MKQVKIKLSNTLVRNMWIT